MKKIFWFFSFTVLSFLYFIAFLIYNLIFGFLTYTFVILDDLSDELLVYFYPFHITLKEQSTPVKIFLREFYPNKTVIYTKDNFSLLYSSDPSILIHIKLIYPEFTEST